MEGLFEFKRRAKRVEGPRVHKITGSLGVYDSYKYYRKIKPKDKKYILTESQYFSIIRQICVFFNENPIKHHQKTKDRCQSCCKSCTGNSPTKDIYEYWI